METVFIVGSGTMGRGIAQVASEAGFNVYVSDINESIVQKNIETVKNGLQRQVQKGKITADRVEEIMSRIKPVVGLAECAKADYIIEAALENVALKQQIFKEVEEISSPTAVLATNTTSCSITEIASVLKNPQRIVGMHFFNPATLMRLVEIMPGILTNEETVEKIKQLSLKFGKDPVIISKEGPAGVTSRILAGLLNEAIWVLHDGIASVDAIDKAVVMGCNHKMGPLSLVDLIGIDIHLAKTKMLFEKTGDLRYRPCYLLEKMVKAGMLGKKAGKGFYDYSSEPPKPLTF